MLTLEILSSLFRVQYKVNFMTANCSKTITALWSRKNKDWLYYNWLQLDIILKKTAWQVEPRLPSGKNYCVLKWTQLSKAILNSQMQPVWPLGGKFTCLSGYENFELAKMSVHRQIYLPFMLWKVFVNDSLLNVTDLDSMTLCM